MYGMNTAMDMDQERFEEQVFVNQKLLLPWRWEMADKAAPGQQETNAVG
jgi:hypothetical protein